MNKSYWLIWLATLLFFAGFYALMIPLPLYLVAVGLADWQISLVLGAFGITSLLVRPVAGLFADRWGRKPVMLFGTLVLLIGAGLMSFVAHPGLLFILRMLQALGYVSFSTAATTLIADLANPERRGAALAIFGVAANVAMTTIPAWVDFNLAWLTLRGAFWLSGGLALLGGVMAWQVSTPKMADSRPFSWADLFSFVKRLRLFALTALLFGLAFGAFFQFTPLLTERRNLGAAGLVYSVYGLSIIATRLLTGRLLDQAPRSQTLIFASLLLCAGLGLFAGANQVWMLLLAAFLIASGSGVLHPLLIAMHVAQVSAGERGRATAVFYLGFDTGIGLGAWILSPAFEYFGLGGLFTLAACFALLGAWPGWMIGRVAPQPSTG